MDEVKLFDVHACERTALNPPGLPLAPSEIFVGKPDAIFDLLLLSN